MALALDYDHLHSSDIGTEHGLHLRWVEPSSLFLLSEWALTPVPQ
jgi:hypothetical protein